MNKRTALSMLLLATGIALGAVREFLFVNLNYQLDHLVRGTPYSYAHSAFQHWTLGMDASSLTTAKWACTGFFVLTNLALTIGMCRVRLGAGGPIRTVVAIFILVAGAALGLFAFSSDWQWLYPVAVQLAHAIQYPIPMLVLWSISMRRP